MIINNGVLIGRPEGMDAAITSFLKICRTVNYFQDLGDFDSNDLDAPQFILILQQWSDEFTQSQILHLLNSYPLSHIVCCYGPWCESDQRTRQRWPPALRVPIHEIADRIELECNVLSGLADPIERTAGLDELFAFQHQNKNNTLT